MRGTRTNRPMGRILADDVLTLAPTAAGQRARLERAAALKVAEMAHDPADAALILEALGMLPYEHATRPWERKHGRAGALTPAGPVPAAGEAHREAS